MNDTSNLKQREKTKPETQWLKEIAIYLSGYHKGKGDLFPLGEHHLKVLYEAIDFINKSPKI